MTGAFGDVPDRDMAPGDVDLDRVWLGVATAVWQRRPGSLERLAGWLLRSPGLARALLITPSLLLPWLLASAAVLAAGAAATLGTVAQHGGQRPDGAAGARAWSVRHRRRARDRRVGGVWLRGGDHVRLAGPDDRGVGAGAGRRDARAVGECGRGRGAGRLGDHGPGRAGRDRAVHRRRQ